MRRSIDGWVSSTCLFLVGCGAPNHGDRTPTGTHDTTQAGGAGGTGTVSAGGSQNLAGSGGGGGGTSVGGSVSNGGANTNSSGGAGAGGGSSGSSSIPYVPPTCDDEPVWPDNAPTLQQGTWTDIAPIPHFYSNGLAFNPCNPAVLYTVGGNYPASGGPGDDTGVYRSTDAGTSWQKVLELDSGSRPQVDPVDPAHVYVIDGVNGSTQGFWRSTDGGETWEQPEGFKTAATAINDYDTYDIATDPTDFNHVLLTFHWYWHSGTDFGFGALNSGVLESTDGGDSWIENDPIPAAAGGGGFGIFFLYDPALGVGDDSTWLFGSQGKGYYRTTNAGDSWTKVSDVSMTHGGSQLYYEAADALYLAGEELLKSTDNGASFTSIAPFNYYLSVIGDGTRLYSGKGGGGRFVTATLGDDTSWSDFNTQEFSGGPYRMTYDAPRTIMYSANAQGGLWALLTE